MSRFMVTKEHRRFTEFANSVRRDRTIGLCYGPAGVGKTLSGQHYSGWDRAHQMMNNWHDGNIHFRDEAAASINAALTRSRTVFYTPQVQTSPRTVHSEIDQTITRTHLCIEQHFIRTGKPTDSSGRSVRKPEVELIVVDEAERLNASSIEILRDRYDRHNIGLILIGMTGIEKQFSRYAQFYSRVGFAHKYQPLGQEELEFVLQRQWKQLGLQLDPDDFTDHQAITAIQRITRGNFRLIDRLFKQIKRVLKINELNTITEDVIEAARSTLVIGTPE